MGANMLEIGDYEKLRQVMNKNTPVRLAKHKATAEMLRSIFNDEEVKLLRVFQKTNEPLSAEKMSELSGVPKEKVNKIFSDMAYKGKILKVGNSFAIMPFVPGLFEFYFTNNRDDPEKVRRAAIAY